MARRKPANVVNAVPAEFVREYTFNQTL